MVMLATYVACSYNEHDPNACPYSLIIRSTSYFDLHRPDQSWRVVLVCDELDYELVWFWSKHASHSFMECSGDVLSSLIQWLPNAN